MQLQLHKRLGDHIKASEVERLDGGGSLRQLSLRRNNEVQVLEAHVRAWVSADAVTSHPRPDVDVEMSKKPLSGAPTIGVFGSPTSKFVFTRLARMVCLEDTMFILVRTESPYVQFVAAALVTSTESL